MVNRKKQNVNATGLKLKPRRRGSIVRWIIMAVIIIVCAMVILTAVFLFNYDEKGIVYGDLDKLATWYYEDYIYANLVRGDASPEEIAVLMERYIDRGFATVHLRQLLMHEEDVEGINARLIEKHCDVNKTTVKFYPEEPFDKKSYRMNWRYDCDF